MGLASMMEDKVNVITGFLNAQYAELVDVVIELLADRREWQGEGVWTMQGWLAWRCGVSPTTAKLLVEVARRADDLPISMQAFRNAELSLDQMAAIARRAPWWTDRQVCTLATMMTVSQIRRTLRKYPFPNLDADGHEIRTDDSTAYSDEVVEGVDGDTAVAKSGLADSAKVGLGEEWCSFSFGDDGVFRLNLATDFETGHIVQSALGEARDRLFRNGQEDVNWVDAIREVAQTSLDGVADTARKSRFRTNVYIDAGTGTTAGTTAGTMTDASGWTVPDAIRRHLTCNGLMSPQFVVDGIPISVGRTQRVIPERTRSVIELRDGLCCRLPGCTAEHWLEVHHIVHWEHGGPTDTWNLVLICAHHHRQHHRGLLGIAGNADLPEGEAGALEFTDRHGRSIEPSGAAPTTPRGLPPEPECAYEHPLGERLDPASLYFQPPPAHQQEINEQIDRDRRFFNNHPDLNRPDS